MRQFTSKSNQDGHFRRTPSLLKSRHQNRRPVHPLLNLQQTLGNQAVQRMLSSSLIQTKLTVGEPGDQYEQQADRVADQVMRMPEPELQRQHEPIDENEEEEVMQPKRANGIQRQERPEEEEETMRPKFAEGIQRQDIPEEEEETMRPKFAERIQRQEMPEEEEQEPMQMKAASGQAQHVGTHLADQVNSLRGGGQALSQSVRNFFEPRFGYDFSRVRIHNDAQAANVSRSLNARAFTVGQDVAFASSQYSPETSQGKKLLAHELTHVVQQGK